MGRKGEGKKKRDKRMKGGRREERMKEMIEEK